jgi:hypothetical protein
MIFLSATETTILTLMASQPKMPEKLFNNILARLSDKAKQIALFLREPEKQRNVDPDVRATADALQQGIRASRQHGPPAPGKEFERVK